MTSREVNRRFLRQDHPDWSDARIEAALDKLEARNAADDESHVESNLEDLNDEFDS